MCLGVSHSLFNHQDREGTQPAQGHTASTWLDRNSPMLCPARSTNEHSCLSEFKAVRDCQGWGLGEMAGALSAQGLGLDLQGRGIGMRQEDVKI